MTDEINKDRVLPVYVLLDVSVSMTGAPIAAANEIVPALIDACRTYQSLADALRFSIITFSDSAKTVVPMTAYREAMVPTLTTEGSTSYGAGFNEVSHRIDIDVASLKADGYAVFRPSIFFVTDGDPTDDGRSRQKAWDALVDSRRRAHPNVITFGVGGSVNPDMIKAYVSHNGRAFVSKSGDDAARDIKLIIEALVTSVVSSATAAAAGGNGGLQLNTAAIDDDLTELV